MSDTNSSDNEEGNKNCNHTKKVKLDEEEGAENVEGRTITRDIPRVKCDCTLKLVSSWLKPMLPHNSILMESFTRVKNSIRFISQKIPSIYMISFCWPYFGRLF